MKIRNKYDGSTFQSDNMEKDNGVYYALTIVDKREYYSDTFYEDDGWEEVEDEPDFAIKWHDLRKDPTDVPNNDRDVWACWNYQNKKYYEQAFYSEGKWLTMFSAFGCPNPDAWCDLPKIEEE